MPGGDGRGPTGQGPGVGRGGGRLSGQGGGRLGGDQPGSGPGGECICPSCGTTTPHQRGIPCNSHTCPHCGTRMTKR